MSIPDHDTEYLRERGLAFDVAHESAMTCVVVRGWPVPTGYNLAEADLLLRLSPGYPDVQPDMWWFDPPLALASGAALQATEVTEVVLGRSWQRWSRHFNSGQWQAGIDGLESYLALIRHNLEQSVSGA